MNAVNQALDERETSEKLEREAEAQLSPAAEAAAVKVESLIDEAVQMRVWTTWSRRGFASSPGA